MLILYSNAANFNIYLSIIYDSTYFTISQNVQNIPVPANTMNVSINISVNYIRTVGKSVLQVISRFDNCITRTDNKTIAIAYALSSSSLARIGAKQQQVLTALLSTIAVVLVLIFGVYIYKKRRNRNA